MKIYRIFVQLALTAAIFLGCAREKSEKESDALSTSISKDTFPAKKTPLNAQIDPVKNLFHSMNQISMPKELTIDDRWWFFEKEREIERNLALKVLLGNDSAKLYQPLGGFYQFFDPVIAGGGVDDHYLVLYKRYSFDCYSGVVLSVFSKEKELVDDIFIAGDSLEYKQKEFYSTGDGQFFIIEYIIDYDNPLGNQRYQGIRIERFYELDSTGMITLTATNRDMNICLREPIGGNIYRFQLCDSTNQL